MRAGEAQSEMRVGMIGPVPPEWGGGGRWHGGGVSSHVRGLLSHLGQEAVAVEFLAENSSAGRAGRFPDLDRVRLHPMRRSPFRLAGLGPRRLLALAGRARRDPVLHMVPWPRRLRFVAQARNYERFLAQTSPPLLHIHRAYHRQYLCQHLLDAGPPVVVTAHSVNALLEPRPSWVEPMVRANFRTAHHFIAVSNYVRDQIIGYGADPARITVINNGVDLDRFRPGPAGPARLELGLPGETLLILFSGNLIPRKGVEHLLRAFQIVHEQSGHLRLLIVGEGPEGERLRVLARTMGIAGAVIFAGRRPFSEMAAWYRAADLYVMPSAAEGLSMAILEAMASGRPVITTRPGTGRHDAVQSGRTGLLVDYGDVEALADAITSLAANSALREEMGARARHRAEEKFGWPAVARRTAEVYHRLLEGQA